MSASKGRVSPELIRSNLLGIVMNLVRTSALGSRVDVSVVTAFVGESWPRCFKEGTYDLAPLYQFLLALPGVLPEHVAGVMLLLQRRKDKLSFEIRMPSEVMALPEAERRALLDHARLNGVASGVTMVGMPRVKQPEESAAKGLTDRVRLLLAGKKDPP